MEAFKIIQVAPDELKGYIEEAVKKAISSNNELQSGNDLITREETAKRLKCNLTTLWRWTKSGSINPHTIGGKVYYKWSEILQTMENKDLKGGVAC